MSFNLDISRSTSLTEEQVAGYVIDATREVFSKMVMMEVTGYFPLKEPVKNFKCGITGMVGFSGVYSGVISVHCPVALALKITSNMVGMDCERVSDDLNDAIGEIANMIGGSVKHLLSHGGLDVRLSIPTVISGEDHTVNSLSDQDCIIVPFTTEGHTVLVGLTLKKED
jgi:chemotaxis protein CheX